MTSMLANEPMAGNGGGSTTHPLLETWSTNERMRHVPPVGWMLEKLDGDLRRRLDTLCAPLEMLFADDVTRVEADSAIRGVAAALERVAEVARHSRGTSHPPNDPARRLTASLEHAITSLRTLDPDLIGRRFPFQAFERSKAEPLYAAVLAALFASRRLVDAIRAIDPDIDGRLDAHLVVLEHPLSEDPMA